MLLEEDMISKELVEKMRSWKHSGFRDLPGTSKSIAMLVSAFIMPNRLKRAMKKVKGLSANTYQGLPSQWRG